MFHLEIILANAHAAFVWDAKFRRGEDVPTVQGFLLALATQLLKLSPLYNEHRQSRSSPSQVSAQAKRVRAGASPGGE